MTPQERAKQQAEVMLAYANGAEIEFMDVNNYWKVCTDPNWNWLHADYRVKKPAPKVVKLEAWITDRSQLVYYVGGRILPNCWKRIPSLDIEYVEDES